jgi:23S rRNA (guanosine2251-2'-O)-methyltransferase
MSADWVVGINAVASALENDPVNVREVLIEARARNPRLQELAATARAAGIALRTVPGDALERIAGGNRHQGVAANYAATRSYDEHDIAELLAACASQPPLLLVLDGVQDPHNLGACLRSAAAAGVSAVVIPKDKSAPLNATVRKTSAGAADRVAVVRVTNLARSLQSLKDAGVWLIGLAGEAEKSLYAHDLTGPIAIVMGGEGEGLRRLTREHCDWLARIPMSGEIESLNVSVATGIALFEVRRQRGGG